MNKFSLCLIGVLMMLPQVACNNSKPHTQQIEPKIISLSLKEFFEKDVFSKQGKGGPYAEALSYLYRQNSFSPFWVTATKDTENVKSFLLILQKATSHGIDPERYSRASLDSNFKNLWLNKTMEREYNTTELCQLEYGLSAAYLLYEHDILYGIINPHLLDSINYDIPLTKHPVDEIANLFSIDRVQLLEKIQPKNERYIKLQKALVSYQKFAETRNWTKVPLIEGKVQKGEKSKIVRPIAENLKQLGLLDSNYAIPASNTYELPIFKAVIAFQTRLGIANDGVIGKSTIEQLNISPKQRVEIIKLNLERFRWTSYSDSSRYILVNIPDFNVYAYSDGKVSRKIKVCTGQKKELDFERKNEIFHQSKNTSRRPKNHETPQVASRIGLIITNPLWGVPENIAKNETLGEILKDAEYLKKHNYKVYKKGTEVDISTIDWKNYSRTNLPFTFVQDAGPGNALGKIKFIFKNKYTIYLHDTPTRAPFNNAVRAVSHGCVRVEKPLQLAEYLLEQNTKYSMDDINAEIGIKPADESKLARYRANLAKKPHSKDFPLDVSVPVYVDYFTAWVDGDGILQFRADVYEKDTILAKALFAGNENKVVTNR